MKIYAFFAISILTILACQNSKDQISHSTGHAVVVQDVLQANAYTYLQVKENDQTFWIAITKADIKKGEKLYYEGGLEMQDFESKDLNRTFERIYFVDQISKEPLSETSQHAGKPDIERRDISVEPAIGGITVAELYGNRQKYAGNTIRIRGEVVKVNDGIMGRNWVHIQDGTSSDGKFDVTITTQAKVSVGQVVTFEGRVALEKDFGAGYFYDVIVEQADLIAQQKS